MWLIHAIMLKGLPCFMRWTGYVLMGACVGLGMFVVVISEAVSYMSDDPNACINCHIMIPQYATWQKSSHGRFTTCNDCHVPHDSELRKIWFKANDGLRHATIFTLRAEPQVIQAIPASVKVIQENCIRCHGQQLHQAVTPINSKFERSCIDCHREVPHGSIHSLSSTPNAAVPPLRSVIPDWMKDIFEN